MVANVGIVTPVVAVANVGVVTPVPNTGSTMVPPPPPPLPPQTSGWSVVTTNNSTINPPMANPTPAPPPPTQSIAVPSANPTIPYTLPPSSTPMLVEGPTTNVAPHDTTQAPPLTPLKPPSLAGVVYAALASVLPGGASPGPDAVNTPQGENNTYIIIGQ